MFNNTKQLFTKEIVSGGEPYLNVYTPNLYTGVFSGVQSDKKLMMEYAKRHAILIGIGNAIANDIFTPISFRSIKKRNKGRPLAQDTHLHAEEKATQFAKEQFVLSKIKSAGYDWIFTGEGFLWHANVPTIKLKELLYKVAISPDEVSNIKGTTLIKTVASTTMSPKYDDKDILYYDQVVPNGKKTNRWGPDRIIHFKLMDLDGKPDGFTPMIAARPMIETLGLIIDYGGNFFDGGGSPERVISFPEEHANSENYKRAVLQYKEFMKSKKRGTLFFAGKIQNEILNDWNKDMEFRQLFVMYVGSIAFAFNMPLHRLQSILGGDMSAGAGVSDLSDSGYWKTIYAAQDYWETLLNVNFWNPYFDVDMIFERTYLQDTFRETQALNMSLTNIETMERLDLIKSEFKREVYSQLLVGVPSEAINENPQPSKQSFNPLSKPNPNNKLSNSNILRGEATQKYSDIKKSQAGNTEAEQRGM